MFGLRYLKTSPTTYVLLYKHGKLVREGAGLAFWYYAPTSLVVSVPVGSVDVPFMFEEVTADFQNVTLQGQLTYRVRDPKLLAGLLDFSLGAFGRYQSDDPQKLNDRLVAAAQVLAADVVHRMRLRELLASQQQVADQMLAGLRERQAVVMLGLEVLALSLVAIRPSPETSKALEAEAREMLLRQADEAIFGRRNAAVEQERLIKESELNTELAIEQKRAQIREQKLAADIAAEQQRAELIEKQAANDQKQADARSYALEAVLRPMRSTDWRILMAAASGKLDAGTNIAMAFREIAENAQKVGELHITPELLASLTDGTRK